MQILIFLVGLFCTCLIAYQTYRCGISPMPTNKKARNLIASILDKIQPQKIIDLGSGWGHLVIFLARRFPNSLITGYEISLIPYMTSIFLKKILGKNHILIQRQDFLNRCFQSEILVCYLYPKAMEVLSQKIKKKSIKGNLLISHAFALPGFTPQEILSYGRVFSTKIYIYDLKILGKIKM